MERFYLKNYCILTSSNVCTVLIFNKSENMILKTKAEIKLGASCACRIDLTVHDVISISFERLLKDIATLISASLKNEEIFGIYSSVKYIFTLVHFNNNLQFQKY